MKATFGKTAIAAAAALGVSFAATGQAAAEALCRIDGGAVYFSQNDADLSNEGKDALNRIAAEAHACEAAAVLVRTGSGKLADERAEAIANELSSRGVTVTRAMSLPGAITANEGFIETRVAEIEIRAPGQSVS